MIPINYLAVVVATVVAFVGSMVWYIVFGKELATVSVAFAAALKHPRQPRRMIVVLAEGFIIALVLAYLFGLIGQVTWVGAVGIGCLLWVGLSAMQWASSIVWENVPMKMAAIHVGDWLLKLVLISAIIGLWR
jgi:Protein of unknown function (DUF1761)